MFAMNYRDQERRRAIDISESLFKDPGNGAFSGEEREFVLHDPSLNLWEGIRVDAQQYFKRNGIPKLIFKWINIIYNKMP